MLRLRFWLSALLCLCAIVPLALAEDDPVIVSVDQMEFRRYEVQAYYDALAKSARESNGVAALTEEQALQLRDAVVKQYIFQGIVQSMYAPLGLDSFSPEEEAALLAEAQKQYDDMIAALLESLRENYPSVKEDKLYEYALATLALQDATLDVVCKAVREDALLERILDYVTPGLQITDEQVETAYVDQYVAVEQEAFKDDIYSYELYLYEYGYEPRYIPAGYRYMKHIMLTSPAELQAKLDEQQKVINDAYEAMETAEAALKQTKDADMDARLAASDVFQEANRDYDAALAQYEVIKQLILDALKPTTDEIYEKYRAGESFESLMDAYTSDEYPRSGDAPFMVHAESYYCDEDIRDTAMALKNPGDISEPVWTYQGVHLLCYIGDAPAYEPMDDLMRQAIYETLVETTRYDALMAKTQEWQSRFSIFSYPEGIDITDAMTEQTDEETSEAQQTKAGV